MWSVWDRSYRLSYRGVKEHKKNFPIDFVGDENNPYHSHHEELIAVENSWLHVAKGSYIYHGTTNSGSYLHSNDTERLLAISAKKLEKKDLIFALEAKPMYFTNKQNAKAYGRFKTKPFNIMLDYDFEEWSAIKVLYQERNLNMGFEVKFETTKDLYLLDFKNPDVVRDYAKRIGNRAPFSEAFVIRDDGNVQRKSSYEKDALWISILHNICRETQIDGYYFCCEGLHEEILIFDPTSLKHIENLYAETLNFLPDIPLKEEFLEKCTPYKSIPPFPYIADPFCEWKHDQYVLCVEPIKEFFKNPDDFSVKVIEVDSVLYVLYFTLEDRENKFFVDQSKILMLDDTQIEEAIKKDDKLFNVKIYADGYKSYSLKDSKRILAHFGQSVGYEFRYCIMEADLHQIPKNIPTSSEFLKVFNPIDFHNGLIKDCNLFFGCEKNRGFFPPRLFPVTNRPDL
tara:strand:- start:4354 stop:5718 length:1365 start_codon:yes stop_codon:yes gene_type:complete